jgi:hypothetical protein
MPGVEPSLLLTHTSSGNEKAEGSGGLFEKCQVRKQEVNVQRAQRAREMKKWP